MNRYIDSEKLKTEIERFSATEYGDNTFGDDVANGALDYVLEEIIPSLQQEQPEVDLERITKLSRVKELPEGFDKKWLLFYHTDSEYNSKHFHHLSTIEREYIIARHFYELGLNAKKGGIDYGIFSSKL